MKTAKLSLNLADILRERIDDCAKFQRNVTVPKEILIAYLEGKQLSEGETTRAEDFLVAFFLKLFLDTRESLITPDDAKHRMGDKLLKNLHPIDLTLVYEDFYAYQFVDKLNDIVHRALKVRDLFAKGRPPESVTRLCQEAYQSYLYGYHTSSVALIRSVVETALKDKLAQREETLSKLNDLALKENVYPMEIWRKVDQIREEANTFIHEAVGGRTPSESKNLELIGLAQEVLQALIE